jgi:hypothetical protein
MNWGDHKDRMRRYLRDPDANIWSNALLLNLYNDSQRDMQQKTYPLEEVRALRLPPLYNCGYLYDWEWAFLNAERGHNYQALRYHQQTERVVCYRFEAGIDADYQDDTSDEGTHFTQGWEAFTDDVSPGSVVPVWFPENFGTAKLVAYNREPLDYMDKKELQPGQSTWQTHSGKPSHYWRYDTLDNSFVIWPRPSDPSWDHLESPGDATANYVYTFTWEETGEYLTGEGREYTIYHTTNTTEYIFDWEKEHLDGGECLTPDDVAMRGQWAHELGEPEESEYGILLYNEDDTVVGRVGGITHRDATLFPDDVYGGVTDAIDLDDNILLIFDAEPTDLEDDDDESDFPRFLRKYIEYDTLAKAYNVNNDGQIESLREYWEWRKELGIKMIQRYLSLRRTDRDYRLTTQGVGARKTRRHPRLPSEYPAI